MKQFRFRRGVGHQSDWSVTITAWSWSNAKSMYPDIPNDRWQVFENGVWVWCV